MVALAGTWVLLADVALILADFALLLGDVALLLPDLALPLATVLANHAVVRHARGIAGHGATPDGLHIRGWAAAVRWRNSQDIQAFFKQTTLMGEGAYQRDDLW